MEKIRVLHCLETVGSGGVEQLRYNLAKYLDRDRFEQKIICTHAIGALPAKISAEGVEVIPVGTMRSPFHIDRYRAALKTARSFRPHIIHGAVFEGISLAAVTGKLSGVPVIVIEETSDPVDRRWKGNLLMRVYASLSDKVVAESEAAGAYVRSVVKVREPKLQVINNAADYPDYPDASSTARLKAALEIMPGDFIVGSVGRLFDEHKKFSDLIKAAALLRDSCPRLKLLIIGEGADKDALSALCADLHIQDRVIFTGYQGNTAPYYACMDVFALASQKEAFGIVLVEAMLFRLPVVATAVGGIPYVVQNGETGILVDKNAPHALADAIAAFYDNPEKRRAFGMAGFQRAEAEFTASAYTKRIADMYIDLVQKKGVDI